MAGLEALEKINPANLPFPSDTLAAVSSRMTYEQGLVLEASYMIKARRILRNIALTLDVSKK